MTSTSAYSTFDTSYATRTPYISATEYTNAPTAIDVGNLLAGTSLAGQQSALTETIGRASSWVDQYTCGAWGSLCATQNPETARVWGNRYGQLVVHPKYWPILSVDAFSYSPMSGGFASAGSSVTPSDSVWIEPMEFVVNPGGASNPWVSGGQTGNWGWGGGGGIATQEYFCQWTYTNGYVNTYLAASVAAGATSIQPSDLTGILPGTMLTLYDLPYDEAIQVAASYVPGTAVVPFANPLQYAHQTTATISNLPPAVKQAAILATTAFIKLRGSGALVVEDMGAVTHTEGTDVQGSGGDLGEAASLLAPFKMQYVGY